VLGAEQNRSAAIVNRRAQPLTRVEALLVEHRQSNSARHCLGERDPLRRDSRRGPPVDSASRAPLTPACHGNQRRLYNSQGSASATSGTLRIESASGLIVENESRSLPRWHSRTFCYCSSAPARLEARVFSPESRHRRARQRAPQPAAGVDMHRHCRRVDRTLGGRRGGRTRSSPRRIDGPRPSLTGVSIHPQGSRRRARSRGEMRP